MECKRQVVYFSVYIDGVKAKRAGYAGLLRHGELCDIQIYYRNSVAEAEKNVRPIFLFQDGSTVEGKEIAVTEGMAADAFATRNSNFLESGKKLDELECIYIEGVTEGICGGRADGQELTVEATYSLTEWMDTVTEVVTEKPEELVPEVLEKLQETWTLEECMERLPEQKLPFDGMRQKCCRMTLEDMERLPKEWKMLKNNHFLLHGYYAYHHVLLIKLRGRYGERYAIGVPGEFCGRDQYMAESFGFQDFAALEYGRKRPGSFGYWYFYLCKR